MDIAIITDDLHNSMIKKSLKPEVCVKTFIDLQDYLDWSSEEMIRAKQTMLFEFQKGLEDNWDYVFVFVKRFYGFGEDMADWIIRTLVEMGYDKYKIMDGYRYYRALYPREKYAYILSNPSIDELDGIVFGISHGEAGIRTEYLPGRVKNFCSSSQDIYFNYLTAQKIWERYYEKVKNVSYVVIEMFDYTYFNFESMLTGATLNFFLSSGLTCPKEFDVLGNKNIAGSAMEINQYLESRLCQLENEQAEIFDCVFRDLKLNDSNAYGDAVIADKHLKEEDIISYKQNPTFSSVQKRIFQESCNRNVKFFISLLGFLYAKNPNIKIILCLIPKYIEVEKTEQKVYGIWKQKFESLISQIRKRVSFLYLNYKEDEEISGHKEYYRDLTHLNINGGIAFSKKLGMDIQKYLDESKEEPICKL